MTIAHGDATEERLGFIKPLLASTPNVRDAGQLG
jgi:hypothetical protein